MAGKCQGIWRNGEKEYKSTKSGYIVPAHFDFVCGT